MRARLAPAVAAVMLALSGPLLAAAGEEKTTGSGKPPAGSAADIDRANLQALLDKPVFDAEDTKVGQVEDVVMDQRGSQAKLLVIHLDDAGKQVAVPFNQVGFHADREQVRLIGIDRVDLASRADFRFDDTMVSLKEAPKAKSTKPE